MKCPIDESPLSVSSREGVEIDFCPQCRGVWLDRGELDKIIDRVSTTMGAGAPPPVESRQADRRDDWNERDRDPRDRAHPDDRKKRRRRGFLDDLFDFD